MVNGKDAYLIGYNVLCCVGWTVVLVQAIQSLCVALPQDGPGKALASLYGQGTVAWWLTVSQSAAVLEIVHAAIRFVRSPVMVTAMQVGSRLVALYAIVYSPQAQNQWGAGVMMLSWSMVEVPRYAFYVSALLTGDATKKTPFPLFWLRYSMFAVLYPTGITGELTVFYAAAKDPAFATHFLLVWYYARFLPIIYFFGSPFMIMNMVGNRKSAMKKRFAKPPPPPRGICWPVDEQGERSSTEVNRSIIAAALQAIDPPSADRILQSSKKKWRFGYVRHLRTLVEKQCQSPTAALRAAQAGLERAYKLFEFVAPDGTATSFEEIMSTKHTERFYTGFIQGTMDKKKESAVLSVPYQGGTLEGDELRRQVQKWVEYGTIEPSAGKAIEAVIDHPEWIQSIQQRYFVLLGAGSAMGPLRVLLALGANVIAIDLDRPAIWKGLLQLAKNSPGSLTFPLKVDASQIDMSNIEAVAEHAGCNLFTHTPMIRDWLMELYPGKPFTVGSYAYLDGALHVQVSLAMDAICRDLSENRKQTSLVYLCTPTDLHLIPAEAHEAAKQHYKEYSGRLYCMIMAFLGRGKFLRKNFSKPIPGEGGDYYLVNGISVAQGPNYALAKRMQHWRAIVARSKGCVVSSNIAPSTSTVSVVHNRTFAWAYEGMPYFKPFEIFEPDTSKAVMLAILLFDLNDPTSVANPQTLLSNPNQLFSYGAFHGGLWRCAYEVDSIGEASVLLYFSRVAKPYAFLMGALGAALGAYLVAQQ